MFSVEQTFGEEEITFKCIAILEGGGGGGGVISYDQINIVYLAISCQTLHD